MNVDIVKLFNFSAGVVFLTTAIAKLISAFGTAAVLEIPDPILDISFRHLLWITGTSELTVALFCIFGTRVIFKTSLVAWFATNFLLYRITFILAGYNKPCSCLGNITEALHIPQKTSDMAMKIILVYLLVGSYASLFWLWRQRKVMSGGLKIVVGG